MVLKLGDASRVELEWVVKRGENWRERERAQTLLLPDQGVFEGRPGFGRNPVFFKPSCCSD